eukprot:CAMPEP_0117060720 /NCGR_PEP_ID=MMETSP0472-20121206/42236_1 /TAXON_ID=693140 ORGANISM="Tiarina fusus, Strain LIS" /NCGR_SAMPLE_ID=MMETSP0472 /ASSEMBLY_ACC=CAM_ASM_000603 /LENGTH=161 /DNA_ID=CAMNT_0004779043 /DNA_START=1 /DNA_END=482 /DNA_ORIENTATION=+
MSENDEETAEETFISKTAAKIFANLQISIKNIHIRYQTSGSSPYAFGITLDSLYLRTTNAQKVPVVVKAKENREMIYKLIELHNLALYWNSFSPAPPLTSKQDIIDFLQCQIHTNETTVPHMNYILHPMSGEAFCEFKMSPDGIQKAKINTSPKFSLRMIV